MSDPTDFDRLLAGLTLREEDHVFIPVGKQSAAVTALHNELAGLLDDDVPDEERSMADSFTARREDLQARIVAQIEADHADAPRVRLRALTDDVVKGIDSEIAAMVRDAQATESTMTREEANTAGVLRQIQAAIIPEPSLEQVQQLRSKLNAGEWARLVNHVTALAIEEAEEVTYPNS